MTRDRPAVGAPLPVADGRPRLGVAVDPVRRTRLAAWCLIGVSLLGWALPALDGDIGATDRLAESGETAMVFVLSWVIVAAGAALVPRSGSWLALARGGAAALGIYSLTTVASWWAAVHRDADLGAGPGAVFLSLTVAAAGVLLAVPNDSGESRPDAVATSEPAGWQIAAVVGAAIAGLGAMVPPDGSGQSFGGRNFDWEPAMLQVTWLVSVAGFAVPGLVAAADRTRRGLWFASGAIVPIGWIAVRSLSDAPRGVAVGWELHPLVVLGVAVQAAALVLGHRAPTGGDRPRDPSHPVATVDPPGAGRTVDSDDSAVIDEDAPLAAPPGSHTPKPDAPDAPDAPEAPDATLSPPATTDESPGAAHRIDSDDSAGTAERAPAAGAAPAAAATAPAPTRSARSARDDPDAGRPAPGDAPESDTADDPTSAQAPTGGRAPAPAAPVAPTGRSGAGVEQQTGRDERDTDGPGSPTAPPIADADAHEPATFPTDDWSTAELREIRSRLSERGVLHQLVNGRLVTSSRARPVAEVVIAEIVGPDRRST